MAERSLLQHYQRLEHRYLVTQDDTFARLVVPNGNDSEPFHRWFHLKEAFSVDLLPAVLSRWGGDVPGGVFLDPYAGGGTATLSASNDSSTGRGYFARSYGIEANPFLHFVAQTKVAARAKGAPGLRELARDAVRLARTDRVDPGATPLLSSFANSAFFRPDDLKRLLQIGAALDTAQAPGTTTSVARLCLAACLEPVSALRRDGRALRHEPRKARANPIEAFLERVEVAAEDVARRTAVAPATILRGNGRRSDLEIPTGTRVTVSLFSPPYLNNIDYTEVYKLEGWFLGFYTSQHDFKQQRLRTVRSHPSIRFPDFYGSSANGHSHDLDALLQPLLGAIPDNRYRVWRAPLFRGYFDDMLETLVALRRITKPGDLVVYVVGNSLHGSSDAPLLVAADLLMARLAEFAGFDVIELVVARRPRRKGLGRDFVRESVVALGPSVERAELL